MTLDTGRWRPPVPIAHRGSRWLWPENTMMSFQAAVDMGYEHIETDLQLSADGMIMCFHDDTLERTTDGRGNVVDHTMSELQLLDAGFRHATVDGHGFRGQGITVPSLEEVLIALPTISLVVDLKCDGLAGPLIALLDDLGAHDRLIVGSFSDTRLSEFRDLADGKVATSTGPALSRLWVLASRVGRGVNGDASALQVPTHMRGVRVVDAKLVDAAHRAGLQVHVWTVNSPTEMARLLDMGVDGLITDRPDLLRELLVQRGQWRS